MELVLDMTVTNLAPFEDPTLANKHPVHLQCQADGNKWSEMANMLTEAAKAKLMPHGKLSNKTLNFIAHRRQVSCNPLLLYPTLVTPSSPLHALCQHHAPPSLT